MVAASIIDPETRTDRILHCFLLVLTDIYFSCTKLTIGRINLVLKTICFQVNRQDILLVQLQ